MHKCFQLFARLEEPADHADLLVGEVRLVDIVELMLDTSYLFERLLVTFTDLAQFWYFLLEQGSQFRHAARELSAHVLLDLVPGRHCLHLVHNDGVSVPHGFEEGAGHSSDGKHSGRQLLDPFDLEERLDFQ